MLLKAGAVLAGLVGAFIGVLVYASPRPSDQLAGKLIIAAAAAVVLLALFVDQPWARAITIAAMVIVLGFAAYLGLSWSGRL